MKKGDIVFVQEPYWNALIPYKAKIIRVDPDTLYVKIDRESPLTSKLVETLVALYQQYSFTRWPTRAAWCEVINEA